MNDISSLLAQAYGTTPLVADKRQEVAAVSTDKKLELQSLATARATGKGQLGVTGVEWDLINLDPAQLEFKYGQAGVQAMRDITEGSNQNLIDARAISRRTPLQASGDTLTGVGSGLVGSLAGIGAWGTGLINDEAGVWAGQKVQEGMQAVEGIQSDGVNAARRQQRIETGLDIQDNTAEYEQSVRQGDDEFTAGLRRWGSDTIDTLANSVKSPTMLGQGTAEAVGSLLAAGPLAKGLRALGNASIKTAGLRGAGGIGPIASPLAQKAVNASAWGTWPAAIAAMEGGGAYSSTVSEVMNTSFEDLARTSAPYRALIKQGLTPEEARVALASDAGMQAGRNQAIVGAVTGGLSRWAETPFRVPTLKGAVGNVLVKEPLEESIQGGTGALTQNLAIQDFVDPDRDLVAGAGEQTALGALYGFSAAGIVQGPGMVRKAGQDAISGTKSWAAERVEAAEAEAEAASPVAEAKVQEAAEQARTTMPELMGLLDAQIDVAEGTTPEARDAEKAYVASLNNTLNIAPEEIQSLPPALQAVVAGATNRVVAVHKLAGVIKKMPADHPHMVEVMAAYAKLREPFDNLPDTALPILDNMEDGEIKKMFQGVRGVIRKANSTLASKQAEAKIDKVVAAGVVTPDQISATAIQTPEGQKIAQQQAALTTLRPGTGNIETLKLLMEHADKGLVNLTRPQKRALNATLTLLKGQELINQAKAAGQLDPVDIVDGNVISDKREQRAAGDNTKRSARMHVNDILSAAQRGDTELAAGLLEDFGKFAQHMQNKLDAFNRHYKAGNPNAKGISFQALSDGDREWFPSEPYIFTNTGAESSIRTAQTVELEAKVLTNIYNGLVDSLVGLGVELEKLPEISLDPALQGDIKQVVAKHKTKKKAKPAAKTEEKPASEAEVKLKAEEKKAEPAPVEKKEDDTPPWDLDDKTNVVRDVPSKTAPKNEKPARPKSITLEPDSKTPDVKYIRDENGKLIGQVIVSEHDGINQMEGIELAPEYRGMGLGLQIYTQLIEEALAQGKAFSSDPSEISPDAERVWAALERRGYTIQKGKVQDGPTTYRAVASPTGAKVAVAKTAPKPEAKSREVFPTSASGFTPMNREQAEGIEKIQAFLADPKAGRVFVLDGKAGTGKTTIMQEALYGVLSKGKTVHISAVSHKAKTVLESKLNSYIRKAKLRGEVVAKALAGLLGMEMKWDPKKQKTGFVITPKSKLTAPILDASVVVVDEASMLDQGAIDDILEMAPPNAKIIFLGDIGQLAPIEGKGEISPIFTNKTWPKHNLVERVRQGEDSAILPYADYYWDNSQSKDAQVIPVPDNERVNKEGLTFLRTTGEMLAQYGDTFVKAVKDKNPNLIKVVAYNNKEGETEDAKKLRLLETKIRQLVHGKTDLAEWEIGELVIMNNMFKSGDNVIDNSREFAVTAVSPGSTIAFEIDGQSVKFPGNRVTVRDFDTGESFTMPVLSKENGMAASKDLENKLKAWANKISAMDGGRAKSAAWAKYFEAKQGAAELTYGYVITSHKAQGSTYGTSIVLEDNFNNMAKHDELNVSRGIYTAITRASDEVVIVSRLNPADQAEVTPSVEAQPTEATEQVEGVPVEEADTGTDEAANQEGEPTQPKLTMDERRARNKARNAEIAAAKKAEAAANAPVVHKNANPELTARYPDLAYTENSYNLLTTMLPAEGSRLVGVPAPMELANDTLSSQENLEEVVGHETKHELTPEVATGYSQLFGDDSKSSRPTLTKVFGVMKTRLHDFVKKNLSRIEAGQEVNRWPNGKALNITNEDGTYNQNLLESAGLAAMQWLLGGHVMFTNMEDHELASLAGVPDLSKLDHKMRNRLATGLLKENVKFAIAAKIREYWGMRVDPDGPGGYTDGIPEAVAAEIMQAMIEVGFLVPDKIVIGPEHGLPQPEGKKVLKTIEKYTFSENAIPDLVKAYPSAIDEMVLVDHAPVRYIDGDVPPVSQTMMNNPTVDLTKDQKRTVKKANSVASRLSLPMLNVWKALGETGVLTLFSKDKEEWTVYNQEHQESIQGRHINIKNAFAELEAITAEMANRAEKAGKPLKAMVIRFAHGISKVGRLQMLGSYNAQGNKGMREVVLPTWSTLDLAGNPSHKLNFMLAIGQHLGVKVDKKKIHQVAPEKFAEATQRELDTTYAPVIEYLRNWMQGVDLNAKPEDNIAPLDSDEILRLLNGKAPLEAGLHSLVEYARFLELDAAGQKAFETGLYLEADGVTNGPIMAMMMMASGAFNMRWLQNVQKGGVHFGPKKAMHELIALDEFDLYKTATVNMTQYRDNVLSAIRAQPDSDKIEPNIRALSVIMDVLLGGDASLNYATGEITFERGVTKNPLTITIYGSSATGIADNFASQIMDLLAEQETEIKSAMAADPSRSYADIVTKGNQAKWDEYDDALALVTKTTIGYEAKEDRYYHWTPKKKVTQHEMLSQNFLHLLVNPMVEGISDTVGSEVMDSARLVRTASQVQSIFMEAAYKEEIEKALIEKAKTTPGWKEADFLSKNDLKKIDEQIAIRFPNVQTNSQVFRVAKSERYSNDKVEYSRGFKDEHRTAAQTHIPTNAGVSGTATIVIGFGDAYMIQVFMNDPAMSGNLPVFDGINMPLDKLDSQGLAANKAAYMAFLQNPVKPVGKAYDSFLDQLSASEVKLNEKMLMDLARAFQQPNELALTPKELQAVLPKLMNNLSTTLDQVSRQIDARHAAMGDVAVSVDHMASANAPYTNGVAPVEMSPEQLLAYLNERYRFHLDNPVVEVPVVKPIQFGDKHATGALLFPVANLDQLTQRVDLTRDQRIILKEVISSLAAKDYLVVSGTREQIMQYRAAHGLSNEEIGNKANGFMVPNEKRVYLINADGEVLAHELVHAATIETLLAYYAGDRSNNAVNQSIERLEVMMKEFMAMPVDWSSSPELVKAMHSAQTAIKKHLSNMAKDPVTAQAAALNEFMAWTLTNKALTAKLKTTPVPRLVKWAKATIDFIRNLLGSRQKVAEPGNDFLSNIQFNTSVLMHFPLTISEKFDEITLFHSPSDRPDLVSTRNTFKRLIVSQVKNVAPGSRRFARTSQALYLTKVKELARKTAAVFSLTPMERSTLVNIVAALGTEMQLNSDVMAQIQTLYNHVQSNLDVGAFLDPADPNSSHKANEKYQLVVGKTDRKVDSLDRTTLLPVFVALATVSPEFRSVLVKMNVPKGAKATGAFDDRVRTLGDNLMVSLSKKLSGQKTNSPTVKAAMDDLVTHLQETLHEEHSTIDKLESEIDRHSLGINAYLRDRMSAFSDWGFAKGQQMMNATGNTKLQKSMGKVVMMSAGMASEKNGMAVAEGVLATAERLNLNNAFLNLAKDFIGRTDDTASIYDLIKPVRAAIQQIRQQFRDSVPKIINETFSKVPTEAEYATMFRSMAKTDLAALIGTMNKTQIAGLFTDQASLAQQIQTLEGQLQQMDPRHFNQLKIKMQQLANFMNTGEQGINLLRNAHAVSQLWNERAHSRRQPVTPEMEKLVDQLTTLYAVNALKDTDKSLMASLVQREADGVDFVLSYLEGQRKTELAKTKRAKAKPNYYKGYTPSLPTNSGNVIVANDSEYVSLTQRGYVRVRAYTGSDLLNRGESRSYYYSPLPARAAFAQGIMQNVDQTAYGIDPASGFSHDMTAGRIVSKRLVAQLAAAMRSEGNSVENLLPVYNEDGKVIAFEQSLDPKELDRLEKSEQLHEMLGVWRGRQVEERFSVQQNNVLIEALKVDWDKNKNSQKRDLYVNLFDKSVLDAVERDAVSLFSDEAKAEIEKQFGKGVFMVRRAMLEDVTGYRNPSVSDFWTNINRLDGETNKAVRETLIAVMGSGAYEKLVKSEQIIQGAVADIRTLIIVKSMIVPGANLVSNIYQLMGRGVNAIRIAKEAPSIVTQLNSYMKSKLEQIRLEAQLRAVGAGNTNEEAKLRAQIRAITDSHKRLAIWPLIEAGEFSTVADVGMSRGDLQLTSGRMDEWVGNQIDKLPPAMQTMARYGLVTKETALFQALQKSVQYGDFVAKMILFNHLREKEGLSDKEALARITEEFVNYDRLPGRTRGGLENMGLLWFYNFKLRMTKVAVSTIRNNPLHAFLTSILPIPTGVGTPLDENIVTKFFEDSLGYTVGPGIALRAPFMNPWINLLN